MEVDVDQIAERSDKVPELRRRYRGPRELIRCGRMRRSAPFLIRYQDRVLSGADNVLYPLLQHDNFMIEDR